MPQPADEEKRHGVLGEQAQPEGESQRRPPEAAAPLGLDQGVERRAPEKQQGRIGRDEQAGKADGRQGEVDEGGGCAGARIVQRPAGEQDEARGAGMQQRRGEAHGPFGSPARPVVSAISQAISGGLEK